jgi:hypothetical protein
MGNFIRNKIMLLTLLAITCLFTNTSNAQVTLFSENWSTSSYATNGWTFPSGQANWTGWTSYTPTGGATPNAFFNWNPSLTNYDRALVSPVIDGTPYAGGSITLDYLLQINNYSNATLEQFAVEYKTTSSATWTLLENFGNGASFATNNYARVNQVLTGMAGQLFQVRFRAYGPNSFNINGWGLDNIVVKGDAPIATPPSCATGFSPADLTTNASPSITLSWASTLGATGYLLTFGDNAPNYDNIFSGTDLGNVTSQPLTGLSLGTTYGWSVTPYNANGNATSCTFNTFTTIASLCDGGAPTYCNVSNSQTCDEVITNVTFGSINNSSGCNYPYGDFTGAGTASVGLTATYPLSVTVGPWYAADQVRAWFDWDQNAVFDAGEEVILTGGPVYTANVTVPGGATLGNTRMRVRLTFNSAPIACGLQATWSEVEDYCLLVVASPPCTVANPGNTIASATQVCPGATVNLSLQNNPVETGLSYQWEESPDGLTWSPILGANANTYTATVAAPTYYHCLVTCAAGPPTVASSDIQITTLAAYLCAYCPATNQGGGCMNNVTINTLNNTTPGCENPPTYYTAETATTNLLIGNTYPFSITVATDFTILSVWIDYDHSGTYDASEWQQVNTNAAPASTSTINITIPGTALSGPTGMRVRSRLSGNANGAGDACLAMGSGETEDYVITLDAPPLAPVICAINQSPADLATNVSTSPTLSWTPDLSGGAGLPDGYLITMGDNAPNYDNIFSGSDLGNVASLTITGLALNTTYGWKIEPYNTLNTASGCAFNTFTTIADLCSGGGSLYCAVSTANTCDEVIQNVTFGSINNSSGCNYPYADFTGVGTATVNQTVGYPISVLVGPFYTSDQVTVWFDWNQNTTFDVGEEVILTGGAAGIPFTGSVVVPGSANLGLTRMRVRLAFAGAPTACGANAFSEVEDYCINVDVPPACAPPTNLGAASITANSADLTFDCVACTGTFELEWGTTGFVQGAGTTVNPATSPVSLAGLTSNTQYSFYVRQDCGGGSLSPWSGPFTFSTLFDCAGAPVISACGVPTTAISAAGNGVWSPGACGFTTPGKEALFSFTPATTGLYDLQVTAAVGFNFVDYFWKEASGPCDATGWNCIDDIIFPQAGVPFGPLTAGTTYWILADPEVTGGTNQTFIINCPPAPITNDDCIDAITIACGSGPVSGTTTGAAVDAIYTNCGAGAGTQQSGVWYKYVGDNQQVTITTCDPSGIGYDTRLTVYSGTCGSLSCVGGNDDMFPACATGGFRSEVTFNALTGTDYFVFVHGFGDPNVTGNFNLNLTCSPLCLPLPGNDDCASAQPITAGPTCVATTGNNACASSPVGVPTCLSTFVTFRDVWYSFAANTTSANVRVTYGTASDAYYAVYDGCGGAQLACGQALSGADNNLTGLTVGATYYVQVLSPTATAGTFDICVTDFVLPDPCTNIINITCATSATSTFGTLGAYNPVATSCGFATPGSELIWSFTAPTTGVYSFVVTNVTGTDYVDYFYKDASGGCSGTGWTCIDDINASATNNLTLTAGVTYLFMGDRENFLGNVAAKTVNISIVCPGTNTWLGGTPDWFAPTNWSTGAAPASCADNVVIPVTPNNPIIVGAPATAGNVDIATGVVLTLQGQTLQVCGNWSSGGGSGSQAVNVGSGEVILQGGSVAHTISGNTLFDILTLNDPNNAVLNTGAQVSIGEGLHLQTGTFGSFAGTLTLLSPDANTAAYIDDFSAGFNGAMQGNVTAQRGVPVSGSNQHFVGSPVNAAALSDLVSLSGANNVYVTPNATCSENQLDASSNYGNVFEWVENGPLTGGCYLSNWRVKSAGNMINGQGYSTYLAGGSVADLTGVANTGSITISGLGNSNWSSISQEGNTYVSGWHLAANPYPSPLYLDDDAHMNVEGWDAQIQGWVTSGPWQGTWNPMLMGTGGDAELAMFQGFQIHNSNVGSSQSFTFTNGERERTSNYNPSFYRLPNQNALQLVVEGNNFRDRTRVFFNTDATSSFDKNYDADKLLSTQGQPTIYSFAANRPERRMGINTLTSIVESPTVPVAFLPGTNGSYTISADGINTFDPTSYIYLEDLQTGTMHNLRDGAYTFTSNVNDSRNRFVLHFTPAAELKAVDATCSTGGTIGIKQDGPAVWNYAVTTNQGVLMSSGTVSAGNDAIVSNLATGVYTITLSNNSGYTVVKNIQVNGASAPAASFTTPATTVATQDITFTNTSADAVNYEWNFGDGTMITGVANPTYNYPTPGSYTVVLTITNAQGCISSVSQTINVSAVSGIVDLSNGKINIFGAENRVYVDFTKMKNVDATIDIYNVIGQQLSTERFGKTTVYAKEIKNLDAAYVIVKVKNGDDTITKKVFIANTK